MRLKITLFFILVLGIITTNAQQLTADKNFKKQHLAATNKQLVPSLSLTERPSTGTPVRQRCGFGAYQEWAKTKGYNEEKYEAEVKRLVQKRLESAPSSFTGIVTIPVVFHSIYRTGDALSANSPNLPASVYQAQIDQLNLDYGNLSGSTYGVAADIRLRFCLAVVDTAGKPMAEPGIDRINGATRGWSVTNTMAISAMMSYFDVTVKPASIWDPYSYFNVWTAAMDNSGLLGYSTFPSFSTLSGLDNGENSGTAGCVINWRSLGSVVIPGNDATYGLGRTLTHESGHFFGLRHIWGDATCGNDYCNDTPPQDAETSGCPATGTLNNCTPSGPKMFENYMDYTDDACVNTFTADQAVRMQTAMDNSSRRLSLITSKSCATRPGNSIGFSSAATYGVSEAGNAGTCPNSKTYAFNLNVSDKATGAATITFNTGSLTGYATATQNVDYTISPASITYTANDNTAKTIFITVIDDQVKEPLEIIKIGFNISGTGVIAGPDKQTINIIIVDNDVDSITVNNTTPLKTILSENFNAATTFPAGWTTSVLDDGSASYTPNQWVVSANGGTGTTGNAAHVTRNVSTKPNSYTNTNTSDAYIFTPLLDATGVKELSLSFKWRCNGEVGYDEGYIGYIPEGAPVDAYNVYYFNVTYSGLAAATAANTATLSLPLSMANTKFHLVFNWFNDETIGSNPPFTIDDILLTGKHYAVATSTDADTALSQYAGQTVNYYYKTMTVPAVNTVIATISNPSQDLGCIEASIQSAGTSKVALTTVAGSYFRTSKVVKILPAIANNTVTYKGTLYFTTAELSPAWTAAEIPALKILKVKDGVSLSGTLTSADAQIITPVFGDSSASRGFYSYTGDFTGFSQFMLVSPTIALPVRFLSFEVRGNKSSITLNWATAQEINNKGFAVERSTDGTHFESIGWVKGNMNSTVTSNYVFNDNFVQPNVIYYYRIRQVDIDNRSELSSVRQAHISKQGVVVTVSPVPAKDKMNIYFSGTSKAADIKLINAQGQLVRSWKGVNAFNGVYGLNVADMPSGIYMLNIQLPEEKLVKKVMIER